MMKRNKKIKLFCVVLAGALLFTGSAFADILIGSGYYNLKAAAKSTARQMTGELGSYTVEMDLTLRHNDEVLIENAAVAKFDWIERKHSEESSSKEYGQKDRTYYNYSDSEKSIYRYNDEEAYNVHYYPERERERRLEDPMVEDPFQGEEMVYLERILDAFVGNLADTIQMEEADGRKVYYCSLSDAQIPALANAFAAFGLRFSLLEEHTREDYHIPEINENISIRDGSMRIVTNENDLFESGTAIGTMVGTDIAGVEHLFTLELSARLYDLDSTVVREPELTEENTVVQGRYGVEESILGSFYSDIVVEEDGTWVKKGTRYVELLSIDEQGRVSGTYREESETPYSFEFVAGDSDYGDLSFRYTNANGEEMGGFFHQSGADIYFYTNVEFTEDGGRIHQAVDTVYAEGYDDRFIRIYD